MHKMLRPLMFLGAALGLGAGLATALNPSAQPSLGGMVLLTPAQVSVAPDPSLPAPVQQLETLHAGNIADKDTTTGYTAFGTSTVTVAFPAQSTVQALRVYGSAPYKVQVQVRANAQSAFQGVPGLGALDLSALPQAAWNTLSLPASVTASDIQLVLTPRQSGGGGLAEVEFWGQGQHANMAGTSPAAFAHALAPQAIQAAASNVEAGQVSAIGDPAAGGAGASFTMKVPVQPSQIARAWLVYELNGAAHWSEAARSVNGGAVQGGNARETASSFTPQAEPVSPASLVQGQNTVAFSNAGGLAPYQVRNVRLVLEPFDGWNAAASATSNQGPANSVLDGDATTGFGIYPLNASLASGQPQLTAQLSQATAIDAIRFALSKALDGTVSVDLLQAGKWQTVAADLPASGFTAGWNALPLSQAVASAVRLRFAGGSSTALLAELAVSGSPAGSPAATPRLAVTFPDNGQYFGDIAYVRGFVEPLQDSAGPATVTVAGKPVTLSQGTFETAVSQSDLGLPSGTTAWSAVVQATYPNGAQTQRTVQFTHLVNATLADQAGAAGTAADLVPGAAKLVAAQGASLDVGADALQQKTRVSMKSLRKVDLAALDHGMINVTKAGGSSGAASNTPASGAAAASGAASASMSSAAASTGIAGYRFLPHGQQFQKPVKVHLPYDKAKLPSGMKESDIKTFYFDRTSGTWQALPTATVDAAKGEVVALTTHFTDMINAVVQTPDSPEATSFNPTQLKDIKVANPGAKVNLIAPPQANAMGDVKLSYPIELPAGRSGHAPQLALGYNSSAQNGWLGVGWDLSVSAIAIDTRWGVPRYDGANETETYIHDGEQLAPVAHRGPLVARTADKTFHARVEGSFRKIIRHGSSPSTYWWEVREKDGTAYYYGGDPTANAPVPGAVLTDGSGNIFKWALRLVQDTNGNTIHYNYALRNDSGIGDGTAGVQGSELYIQAIDYTGQGSTPGAYTVQFQRDWDLHEARRADPVINARGGFKMVTADLLRKIQVSYSGQPVRSYELIYKPGTQNAYNKTLLATLKQYDAGGALFNQHQFNYFDDSRDTSGKYLGFTGGSSWSAGNDQVQASGPLGSLSASALGAQQGSGGGAHLYAGVSLDDTKNFSVGAKVGSSFSDNDGLLAFIDIDGDGLPDKVFYNGGTISYRKNLSAPGPNSKPAFDGTAVPLLTLPAISHEHNDMTSAGPEAYAGFDGLTGFVGFNAAYSQSKQTTYFADVNGDGLVDLVADGTVYFNHLVNNAPVFTTNSYDTPNPVGAAAVAANLTATQQAAAAAKLDAANPLIDTVSRWVAPFAGTVAIAAPVNLVQDTSQARAAYKTADGVRVAIQRNSSELWSLKIAQGDYAPKTPTGVSAISVAKGDVIYFRVGSVNDGAYDQVSWTPQIVYQNVAAATDSSGLNPYSYNKQADFTLHGLRQLQLGAPYNGTVKISGSLNKLGTTSDDVSLVLYKNGTAVSSQAVSGAFTGATQLNQSVSVQKTVRDSKGNITKAGDKLELKIVADSRIDVTQLAWDPANPPTLAYTASPDVPQGNALPSMELPVSIDLYAASDQTQPLAPWVAPADGSYSFTAQATASSAGSVVVTAKNPGTLLAKQTLALTAGVPGSAALTVNAKAGDKVFFEFQARDPNVASGLTYSAAPSGGGANAPAALYSATPADILAQDYRGWTHFGYNGQGLAASQPISISSSDLTLSNLQQNYGTQSQQQAYKQKILDAINAGSDPSTVAAPFQVNVFTYLAKTAQGQWQGPDASLWVSAAQASSSRRGAKYIPSGTADPYAGMSAPARVSETTQTSVTAGVSVTAVNGSVSNTQSVSHAVLDFKDLNGDGYPDVIAGGKVQYSPMTGGLEGGYIDTGMTSAEDSHGSDNSFGVGGSYASSTPNHHADFGPKGGGGSAGGATGSSGLQMPPLSLGANFESGTSSVDYNLVDINGDGLPDRVTNSGGTLTVQINLGYKFAGPETWGGGAVNSGQSQGTGISGGFNDGIYGFAGGVNLSHKNSKSVLTLFDINGDGLPDLVSKTGGGFQVSFNTGGGFAAPVDFPSAVVDDIARSRQEAQGGGVYIVIPLYFSVLNPGADVNVTLGRTETLLADIDGDGYPDFLTSTSDSSINAGLNSRGRTNLLQSVTRPLGGSFAMAYARTGNTYAQESSRWVLSGLTVNDGLNVNGQDTEVTAYNWNGGNYDRREREFYGFAQCVETHLDPANGNAAYRTVTRNYNNSTYYLKGLLAEETLSDPAGNKYTDAAYTYEVRDESTQQTLANPADLAAVAFPQHKRTDKYWFEGQATAGKKTYQTFSYDQYGNIVDYQDTAEGAAGQLVDAKIGYWVDLNGSDYIIKANAITVYGGGQVMRQRQATFEAGTGNLRQVVKLLAGGTGAVTDLTYDTYGNVLTATGPANATGQRYAKTYTYDPAVHTYVTSVGDSFGYTSTAAYDYRFGVPISSTDLNSQTITTQYDSVGRATAMVGPYEQGTGRVTIAMDYHPDGTVPWAHTAHLDLNRGPSATLDTVTFVDGLERAIETKKTLALHGSGNASMDVMSVSGRVQYDGFGRAIQQYYPTTEPLGQAGTFNAAFDTVKPTVTTYDLLDRPLTVANPANETTRFAYGFGPDRDNAAQFWTRVTDANGVSRDVFRNVRDDITSVRLLNNGGTVPLWTSYAYDPLDEILTVTDNASNKTLATYDNFGRRVTLTSPDAGATSYVFDLASNLTSKITANLKAAGQAVSYSYQYNRLQAVTYPKFPGNNVAYTYGGPGAAGNGAGRVILLSAQGGTLQRAYGPLGEVVKEIRTPAQSTVTGPNPVFTTLYSYDTWNRIQTLTFPDGELVTFNYDSGGNIKAIAGQKQATAYNYLTFIGYDKFEARERVALGNGTATSYSYNPLNRRMTNLLAQTKSARTFMNMAYGYDAVGNIKTLANSAAIPASTALYGGTTSYSFGYDDLYQLTSATGAFAKPNVPTQQFTLGMAYDGIHNITRKTQTAFNVWSTGAKTPNLPLTYDNAYAYAGGRPHAASLIGNHAFKYDLDGNQAGWNATNSGQNRVMVWDEDNRLQSVTDSSQQPTTFKYDDGTNRVVKKGSGGETLYINPWYVAALGRNSKQIFAGATRIATKLEQFPSGEGYGTGAKNLTSFYQYFYHPDHLGSTGFVTDATGEVYQHLEYFPFGETWVDEVSDDTRVPWRFTGQEFDAETRLYYYGARYYDPRTSVWESTDPALGKYLGNGKAKLVLPSFASSWRAHIAGAGMGGAFNPPNMEAYGYAQMNPLRYTDPDGNEIKVMQTRGENDTTHYEITYTARLSNQSSTQLSEAEMNLFAAKIKSRIERLYSGSSGSVSWATKVDITTQPVSWFGRQFSSRHEISLVNDLPNSDEAVIGGEVPKIGSSSMSLNAGLLNKGMFLNPRVTYDTCNSCLDQIAAHEFGHNAGLDHVEARSNLMFKSTSGGNEITLDQIRQMDLMYYIGRLNR